MNGSEGAQPAPLAIYPCTADVQWVLLPEYIAIVTRETSGQPRLAFWLDDIEGIDYREPDSARLIVSERAMEQVEDEAELVFSLEARFRETRLGFLQMLRSVAPGCRVSEVAVSPKRELKRRRRDAEIEASLREAKIRRTEWSELKGAPLHDFEAQQFERALTRPDGSIAPRPMAVIGRPAGNHVRLYPDALVFINSSYRHQKGGQQENAYYVGQIQDLHWARSMKNKCFIAPPPSATKNDPGGSGHT